MGAGASRMMTSRVWGWRWCRVPTRGGTSGLRPHKTQEGPSPQVKIVPLQPGRGQRVGCPFTPQL